jgi:hypothetical protein
MAPVQAGGSLAGKAPATLAPGGQDAARSCAHGEHVDRPCKAERFDFLPDQSHGELTHQCKLVPSDPHSL